MAVRKFKPTTPGQRHKIIGTFEEITAAVPEKSLVTGKRSTGGRNNDGKMTMRYRGGGHKRFLWYRSSYLFEGTNNLLSLARCCRLKFTYCHLY